MLDYCLICPTLVVCCGNKSWFRPGKTDGVSVTVPCTKYNSQMSNRDFQQPLYSTFESVGETFIWNNMSDPATIWHKLLHLHIMGTSSLSQFDVILAFLAVRHSTTWQWEPDISQIPSLSNVNLSTFWYTHTLPPPSPSQGMRGG